MVIDYSDPIAIVGNFLVYYIQYVFAYLMLTPRMKPLKTALFALPFPALNYIVCVALVPWPLLRGVVSVPLSYAPLLLFFSDKLFRRVVVALLCAVLALLADMVSCSLLMRDPEVSYLSIYAMLITVTTLETVIFAVLYFRSSKRQKERLAEREQIIAMLIPFTQYISILGWTRYYAISAGSTELRQDATVSILIVVSFVFLADYLFFKSIRRTIAATKLEAENAALAAQIAAQERYYVTLEDQFAANRKIRHDISNHLYTVKALLAEGRHDEAEKYAGEYLKSVSDASLTRLCEEPSVNAFLLYKREELEKNGISTDFGITLPADTGISSVDLVTVLGNLLDNAEEACRDIPGSTVRLRISCEEGMITISGENPYAASRPQADRIPGLSRGAGYTILQNMAEKHGGVFSYEKQDGLYRCVVRLMQS